MGDNHVALQTPSGPKKLLITGATCLVSGVRPIAVFADHIEPMSPAELAALAQLIVDGFLALFIRRHASIQSGLHGFASRDTVMMIVVPWSILLRSHNGTRIPG